MVYEGFDLTQKTTIVTGAGTGIGKAIAVGLAQAGADVVLIGRRLEPLQEAEKEVTAAGGKALVLQGDISDLTFHSQVVSQTIDRFGKIDVLFNNAAVLFKGPIEETTEEIWDTTMNINLKGNFFLALAVGREMIKVPGHGVGPLRHPGERHRTGVCADSHERSGAGRSPLRAMEHQSDPSPPHGAAE
jgi:NAD(P)-dependent dehydrogenase (short-subunit alcohol dehydrogenase family)